MKKPKLYFKLVQLQMFILTWNVRVSFLIHLMKTISDNIGWVIGGH